jgi:carboxymethylenebutenolidase
VHYFDKTGTVLATPLVALTGFSAWLQTINDATTWVASLPGVDPHRIALMGMSLGAALAVSEASRDLRIKALANWSGDEANVYEHSVHNTITHLPPTIILHGALDPISSVDSAYALQSMLQSFGAPYELEIYPNEGHVFSPSDQMKGLQQILAFFQTYLAK